MQPPARYWPDGRPVGGVNGYPEEYRHWQVECQCRYVVRAMKAGRDKDARRAIFEQWRKKLPGVTKERVIEIWKEGVPMKGDHRG